ncbi:MAG: alpha-ketoacid dehydrogenase subunit beta [Alphaproteobacteria bacterium CG11_big_fil_rev_8_21_14_0_20_44_7]|nr:MAG: alpha-ketoacid dehydrogenase subunit beta [Alphaproteobacteria bacterium CG11_big_fil_rev_8_21_14_0_20_44_7]
MSTPSVPNERLLKFTDAIAEATAQEMSRDEKVFLFGLDVDDHIAIQGTTAGLLEKFGAKRVFGTPLSEDAMTGVAIGAAMAGYRPIHVHIRMDFMLLCMNQLINMAAKSHYVYNGEIKVPLVIRTMIGRSWGQGAQHSQALHSMFMHVPGLKVVAPSTAYDAKGTLAAAIRDDNPVIFMEHRMVCGLESIVPEGEYIVPLGKGRVMRKGADITIVGISHMVVESLRAADILAQSGISAEVIDPITLRPLDIDLIVESVKKTGNLLVVDNGWLNCGASAEIITQVMERIDSPIKFARMGYADSTCPTTRKLEDIFYPSSKTIAQKTLKVLGKNDMKIDWEKVEIHRAEIEAFKGPF